MARRKSKASFPRKPMDSSPSRWLSIDPAGGKKPTVAVLWQNGRAVEFIGLDHSDRYALSRPIVGTELVVLEGGGFVGENAAAALMLERVRERVETICHYEQALCVPVSPDQWRMVLGLAPRPRKLAVDAGRRMCRMLAGDGCAPSLPLAQKATNDDKRAALLIGLAALRAWGWNS